MTKVIRSAIALGTVVAMVSAGCQPVMSNGPDDDQEVVSEFHPAGPRAQWPARDSGEYVLWRWMPTTAPAGGMAAAVSPPVREVRTYVHRGEPIGFRRRPDGLVVAVAGPTTRAVVAGTRYGWHRVPRPASELDPGVRDVLVVGAVVAVVAGVVVALIAIDHNDPDAHLGRAAGDFVGGVLSSDHVRAGRH